MKRVWVEISCDHCGCADHYAQGAVNAVARYNGWIITRDDKHFCKKECKNAYKDKHSQSVK